MDQKTNVRDHLINAYVQVYFTYMLKGITGEECNSVQAEIAKILTDEERVKAVKEIQSLKDYSMDQENFANFAKAAQS